MRNLRPLLVVFLTLLSTCAFAAGPVLTPTGQFLPEGQAGQSQTFHVVYTNLSGDPATTMEMIIDGPAGQSKIPGTQPQGTDPGQGITYTFLFTPQNTGEYKYHFHAVSSTGQDAVTPEAEYSSYSLVAKWVILAIGIIASMVFLPFIVYLVARSVNKRGNPGTAARVGLLIGVLAAYALYAYLFHNIYNGLGLAIAGVIAVGLLIALFSRR